MKSMQAVAGLVAIVISALAYGEQPVIDVYKSPHCGCCTKWEAILRESGFTVHSHPTENMSEVKSRFGVPAQLASCHTGVVNGYFIEGHVPAGDIHRLLEEAPEVRGLSVPGMPAGENVPGMETRPGNAKFDVWVVREGDARIFSRHE